MSVESPPAEYEEPDPGDARHRVSRQREDDAHQRRAARRRSLRRRWSSSTSSARSGSITSCSRSSSDSVVVLENGCLCCTVRSDLDRHAQFALPRAPGRRDSRIRQRRHRDVGPRRARPGAAGFPFGADSGRTLSRRERADARRRRQLGRHCGSARRVGSAGRARRPDPHHANSIWSPATGRTARRASGSISAGSIPSAEIAEVDWSSPAVAKLLTSPGFDAADPRGGSPSVAQCSGLSERRR